MPGDHRGSVEVTAQFIGLLEVLLDQLWSRRRRRVEVDMLNVFDAWETEGPVVHHLADGVTDPVVVGVSGEYLGRIEGQATGADCSGTTADLSKSRPSS